MKHVKTLNEKTFKDTMKKGGCGECQTSCQSACKTSCTVGNQSCEHKNFERHFEKRWMWRMPDIMSVSLQDFLYSW